jgi:hypothetical protein
MATNNGRTPPGGAKGRSAAHRRQHRQAAGIAAVKWCEAGDCRKAKLSHFSTAAQSELFDTDSENDPVQKEDAGALSSPPVP